MDSQNASGVVSADRPSVKASACVSRKFRHTVSVPHTPARSATMAPKSAREHQHGWANGTKPPGQRGEGAGRGALPHTCGGVVGHEPLADQAHNDDTRLWGRGEREQRASLSHCTLRRPAVWRPRMPTGPAAGPITCTHAHTMQVSSPARAGARKAAETRSNGSRARITIPWSHFCLRQPRFVVFGCCLSAFRSGTANRNTQPPLFCPQTCPH